MTTRSRVIVEQLVQAFFGEPVRGPFGRHLIPFQESFDCRHAKKRSIIIFATPPINR